jgi:hypothetical protein
MLGAESGRCRLQFADIVTRLSAAVSSVPRYGMWYLGCMTEALCKLKQSLQRLKERRKMVRKTEGTNDSVDAVKEYFDRLQTLR